MKKLKKLKLEKKLSDHEMKNIVGGVKYMCLRMDYNNAFHTFHIESAEVGTAWCNVWSGGFGQPCSCRVIDSNGGSGSGGYGYWYV
ncbi:MAG: hypothetical protein LUH15_20370 [Tannerellaceae bacterium]|nr:hypothetical protein [Tannerellaceae bacterium]